MMPNEKLMTDNAASQLRERVYGYLSLTYYRNTRLTDQEFQEACAALDALANCAQRDEQDIIWEYGHAYLVTDGWERGDSYGENRYVREVTKGEYDAHKPSGHNAAGEPYWNYIQVRRRKAGPWEPASIAGSAQ